MFGRIECERNEKKNKEMKIPTMSVLISTVENTLRISQTSLWYNFNYISDENYFFFAFVLDFFKFFCNSFVMSAVIFHILQTIFQQKENFFVCRISTYISFQDDCAKRISVEFVMIKKRFEWKSFLWRESGFYDFQFEDFDLLFFTLFEGGFWDSWF